MDIENFPPGELLRICTTTLSNDGAASYARFTHKAFIKSRLFCGCVLRIYEECGAAEHDGIWMGATESLLDVSETEQGGQNIPDYGSTAALVMSEIFWCMIGPVGKLIANKEQNHKAAIVSYLNLKK